MHLYCWLQVHIVAGQKGTSGDQDGIFSVLNSPRELAFNPSSFDELFFIDNGNKKVRRVWGGFQLDRTAPPLCPVSYKTSCFSVAFRSRS